MGFKEEIISIIKADKDCDWDAIVNHRNTMQCYKFNSAIAHALNENGVEALLVGTHYPRTTANCSNYYVLARDKKSGEAVLVDGWVNNLFEGMKEPFIGSMGKAKEFSAAASPRMRWEENVWDLNHIVLSSLNKNIPSDKKARDAFQKKWGEFGEALIFDQPRGIEGPVVLENNKPLQSSGHTISLQEMNNWAMRSSRINTNNFIRAQPVVMNTAVEQQISSAEPPVEIHHTIREPLAQKRPEKGGWSLFRRRSSFQETSEKSSERS